MSRHLARPWLKCESTSKHDEAQDPPPAAEQTLVPPSAPHPWSWTHTSRVANDSRTHRASELPVPSPEAHRRGTTSTPMDQAVRVCNPIGSTRTASAATQGTEVFHHKTVHADQVPLPTATSTRWKVIGHETVVSNKTDPATTHHEIRQILPQAEVTRTDEDLRRETGVEGERGERFSPLLTNITSGCTRTQKHSPPSFRAPQRTQTTASVARLCISTI